jgi:peptidoglycan/xylan/chitin deacetylase (PgdA/CDA1 family)
MADLAEALHSGRPLPPRSVVLTFDDGYRDMLTTLAPLLEEYSMPAAVYLATAHLDGSRPCWCDRLYGALAHRTQHCVTDPDTDEPMDCKTPQQGRAVFVRLRARLRVLEAAQRDLLLDGIARQLAPDSPSPRLMLSWDEARELRSRHPRIELGVHTQNHVDLGPGCAAELASREIGACIADFERELGERPKHFAFPYGRWTPSALELLREAGFRSAVVSGPGRIVVGKTNPLCIPRVASARPISIVRYRSSVVHQRMSRGPAIDL